MDLAQLDELDFASWKNPWADLDDEAPEIAEDTRRVLTLRRLLETARDYERPVDLAIETKHPTRYAGLVERRPSDQDRRVMLAVLTETGLGALEAAAPTHVKSVRNRLFDHVERWDLAALARVFQRVRAGLEADEHCQAARAS